MPSASQQAEVDTPSHYDYWPLQRAWDAPMVGEGRTREMAEDRELEGSYVPYLFGAVVG